MDAELKVWALIKDGGDEGRPVIHLFLMEETARNAFAGKAIRAILDADSELFDHLKAPKDLKNPGKVGDEFVAAYVKEDWCDGNNVPNGWHLEQLDVSMW